MEQRLWLRPSESKSNLRPARQAHVDSALRAREPCLVTFSNALPCVRASRKGRRGGGSAGGVIGRVRGLTLSGGGAGGAVLSIDYAVLSIGAVRSMVVLGGDARCMRVLKKSFFIVTLLETGYYSVKGIDKIRESAIISGSGLDILDFFLLLQYVLIDGSYLLGVFIILVNRTLILKQSI